MENFTSEQKEGANKLQFIIAGIMIIVCETPYLSRNMNTTFVVILMILFFSISFLSHKSLLVENIKSTLIILSYCLIELFYKIIGISTAGVGYYYATAKFFFIFFVSLTILPELSLKQKKILLSISVIGMLINMISNAIIYSRMDTSAYVVYYLRDGQATNAADTAFSTAVLLLMGAAFMYYLNSNRKIKKIIAIAITIFSGYFLIFIAQRGTTFFLSIIMISVLAVSQVSSKTRILFLLLFIFVILWMIMGGAVTLLSVIGKALEGQRIAYKVNYLTNLFRTGNILEAGGSLSDRFMLTMRSYYTFTESFKNFLIGVGDHRNSNEVIGNHSQIIDTFARYGIVGGCLLIASLYEIGVSVIKLSKLSYNTALRLQVISIFFCFTIRGLLGNNMVGSIGTQLFITIPLIVNILTLEGEDSQ